MLGYLAPPKRTIRINFRLSESARRAVQLLNHSYQLDKRFRLHLFQCPAALNFHGTLRSSKLVRNLLIELARDNHGNHLPLARSQRVEAPLDDHHFFFLFTPGTISLQCNAYRIEQILISDWLGQEFD